MPIDVVRQTVDVLEELPAETRLPDPRHAGHGHQVRAGIGKSRLGWEFFKYVDGLADDVYWHRGRCIAYGEGVTYWALAEMVRGRAGIAEEEVPATAAEKLSEMVARFVGDMEERRWIEGRLA